MLGLFRRRRVDPQQGLREALGDFELPSFPAVVLQALARVRDPHASMQDVADTLASDPGLSARLLSTVNSAVFALRHPVKNVHHAAALLGRGEIESILISMAVRQTLPGRAARGFDPRRFWHTSARRATVARALADRVDPSRSSESFTASLLQDMAIPLLAHRLSEYGTLLESWHEGEDDLTRLERGSYEWDHALIASWMCESWKFPQHLTSAIALHHAEGEEGGGLPAANLVAVLRENEERDGSERLVEAAHQRYGLSRDETARLLEASQEQAAQLAGLFA